MENPRASIGEAFDKLKQSISDDDAYDFASTDLKDVWQAVREIDDAQRQRQSAQNLRRIEPFLRGLEKYAKVIEVICNGTPYLPYVWAPIKLMLQLASQHRDVFEALLNAYEDIGAALPRFDRYEKAFSDNAAFQAVLATVYTSILEFYQRAYRFFRRRAWHILFLSFWKDFGARFASIIDGLKKQRDFVDREAVSINILESKDSRLRAQEEIEQRQKQDLLVIEQNETILRNLHLQHSVAWLSVDDKDQETRFERLCRRRHNETCGWVLKQPQMESWVKDDAKNAVLWLSGKPGAGKSVMCSYIVSRLSGMPNVDVFSFFCTSQDLDDSCSLILRTIALQLLRQHPDLTSLVCNEFVYKGVGCVLAQLRILIPRMLETAPCVRLVIDGIDETSKETQRLILKELQSVCFGRNLNTKILFSSRREAHLAERLAGKPQILLDGSEGVTSDIQLYVEYKMQRIETSNIELLDRIRLKLLGNAKGMFLWVRLVVEELRGCFSDWDLEQSAESLPKGLGAAYARILDRIKKERGSAIAIRILEWMAHSYRPLKVYELLEGISFRSSSSSFDNRPEMKRDVLNLCRPLVEDGPSDTLDFVHFSAKEYILMDDSQDGIPFIKSEDANFNISFACVACINTSRNLLPDRSSEPQRAALIVTGRHCLLSYANQFWIDHLLAYCAVLENAQKAISSDLSTQLTKLLQFQIVIPIAAWSERSFDTPEVDELKCLDHLPNVKAFVCETLRFKKDLKTAGGGSDAEQTVTDLVLNACDTDSTYFSTLRHNYQSTLERLMSQQSGSLFPMIEPQLLQKFSLNFGQGAFVCRHLDCSRASDGFDTPVQRDAHESAHRRQFRCDYPSCVNFSTGFTKRSGLNRHNKQYHQAVDTSANLAEIILTIRAQSKAMFANLPQSPNAPFDPTYRFNPLQQQMTSLRQTQMQQHRMPQNAARMEQVMIAQMDNVDIPQIFQNHRSMPQGTPPEIKKWGQLKQWISQNPNAAPNSLDAVKLLQRMHYAQEIRNRQQQGQAEGLPPGAQGPQEGVLTALPIAASVAPMGQNPMQVPNGMNMAGLGQLRMPTTREIHAMRNHPSGKLALANDDQIRSIYMRNQASQIQAQQGQGQGQGQGLLTPQLEQHRRQIKALQIHRMQQANGQQPPFNGQPPNPNQMGLSHPKPGQISQFKQPQSVQRAHGGGLSETAFPERSLHY